MRTYKELLEALTPQQRMNRSVIARRTAKLRSATKELNKKARKSARNQLKQRFMLGTDWTKLSASAKQQIEKMIDKRKGAIEKRAMRMLPQIRKGEAERLQRVQRK